MVLSDVSCDRDPKVKVKVLQYMCDILINVSSILIHGDISLPGATSFDRTVLQNAIGSGTNI